MEHRDIDCPYAADPSAPCHKEHERVADSAYKTLKPDENTIVIRFTKPEIELVQAYLALGATGRITDDSLLIRERIRQRLNLGLSLLREHEPAQAGPAALELVGVAPLNVPAKPLYRWVCDCDVKGTWREDRKSVVRGMNRHVKQPHDLREYEARIEEQPRRTVAHLSAIDKWSQF